MAPVNVNIAATLLKKVTKGEIVYGVKEDSNYWTYWELPRHNLQCIIKYEMELRQMQVSNNANTFYNPVYYIINNILRHKYLWYT